MWEKQEGKLEEGILTDSDPELMNSGGNWRKLLAFGLCLSISVI